MDMSLSPGSSPRRRGKQLVYTALKPTGRLIPA